MFTRDNFTSYIRSLQTTICDSLEQFESDATFLTENWAREGGGGGITRVLQKGKVFEKAGVNTSEVHGMLSPDIASQLHVSGSNFFAAGISLVLHPVNPFVPTVHANFRYFEINDKNNQAIECWFGGGADLTPYYLFEEDAIHFHSSWKNACDKFDKNYYPTFKENCDQYFVNRHRGNERRGIGGIFYDHMKADISRDLNFCFEFSKACGNAFLGSYLPIVEKRKDHSYNPEHTYWQEIRRGRYVEFNLLHDRGTLFGIKSNGRTESILMSLPPRVRFDYEHAPKIDSQEDRLLTILQHPKNWC